MTTTVGMRAQTRLVRQFAVTVLEILDQDLEQPLAATNQFGPILGASAEIRSSNSAGAAARPC
ncbi:MAG TPA: hypothetical protein VH143_19080 [Kofleriaceae bacterium]|nr:hypothetical protein [Kofleriaceae bacterium]